MIDFIEAVRNATGGAPSEIKPGKLIRFATSDKRGDDNGWCKLFDDGEGGVYGCWRQSISETWQVRQPRTPGEQAAFLVRVRKAQEEAKRLEAEQRAECRKRSAELWSKGKDVKADHLYLLAKGIKPHGIKQLKESLLVPVRDAVGTLHGLQFIEPDASKKFKTGTAVTGCYHAIGKPNGTLLIAEGYATGAALYEITGHAVAVTFNAGNLKPVAEVLRAKLPDTTLIVCADDDHATEGNPGLTKATEAAMAVNGLLAVPSFPDTRGPKDTDFQDMAKLTTPEAVRACIDGAAIVTPCFTEEVEPQANLESRKIEKIKAISVFDFMQIAFPPRRALLAPWLPVQGLTMVYAPRGIGKTHFSLGVAYAVSSGGKFLNWTAPEPAGVLFLDGEMPANVLQERIARISVSEEKEPAAPFQIITPDMQPNCSMLDLSRPEDQRHLQPFLEGISLIIVDNLSTLCRTGKENEGEGWLSVQQWALQQRASGRSVLFIHHAGKNGEQRGTSRREDVLDTVIALKHPGDYSPDKGACFEVHFDKARGLFGDDTKPFEAQLLTTLAGRQEWTIKHLEQSTAEKVAALLNDGIPQNEIAELIGISKGWVSKAKKKAMEAGLIK